MNAVPSAWSRLATPSQERDGAPRRPVLARWAAIAGVLANLWLVGTFFLNWSWQAQLGSVAPLGIVWFAGWWRWQRELDRFEVAELEHRIGHETLTVAGYAAAVERAQANGVRPLTDDPRFEECFQMRRAMERRAEAEAALAQLRATSSSGWRRRHASPR